MMSIIACDFNYLECFDQPLAAIFKNGCHGHRGANLRWPNIHVCSQDIYQHICQIWCLYHKMNNWFDMLCYAAPLKTFCKTLMSLIIYEMNVYLVVILSGKGKTAIRCDLSSILSILNSKLFQIFVKIQVHYIRNMFRKCLFSTFACHRERLQMLRHRTCIKLC